ncbi:MAG TPA: hypothetical protein VGR72_00570 [Candidatus Acidoferrales bacterium]|nr:hypothetical protein [Candidatus Acidoferrales bacterium]
MPDWEQQLKERLAELKLAPAVQEEVIAEFAGHLEDAHEGFLKQGIGADEAARRVRNELSDSRQLARRIQRAKQGEENMNNRTKQLWLPALVTSGLGTAFLAILEDEGIRRLVLRTPPVGPAQAYPLWLLSLPVLGFLGAYWSRRAGGAISARIIAGIFLSLIYFAVPFMILPIALVVDHRAPTIGVLGLAWLLLNWAFLPCLAQLLGALPAAIGGRDERAEDRSAA